MVTSIQVGDLVERLSSFLEKTPLHTGTEALVAAALLLHADLMDIATAVDIVAEKRGESSEQLHQDLDGVSDALMHLTAIFEDAPLRTEPQP